LLGWFKQGRGGTPGIITPSDGNKKPSVKDRLFLLLCTANTAAQLQDYGCADTPKDVKKIRRGVEK